MEKATASCEWASEASSYRMSSVNKSEGRRWNGGKADEYMGAWAAGPKSSTGQPTGKHCEQKVVERFMRRAAPNQLMGRVLFSPSVSKHPLKVQSSIRAQVLTQQSHKAELLKAIARNNL
ncbi:unnamed protein product, partial [Urochloa humidicola]